MDSQIFHVLTVWILETFKLCQSGFSRILNFHISPHQFNFLFYGSVGPKYWTRACRGRRKKKKKKKLFSQYKRSENKLKFQPSMACVIERVKMCNFWNFGQWPSYMPKYGNFENVRIMETAAHRAKISSILTPRVERVY